MIITLKLINDFKPCTASILYSLSASSRGSFLNNRSSLHEFTFFLSSKGLLSGILGNLNLRNSHFVTPVTTVYWNLNHRFTHLTYLFRQFLPFFFPFLIKWRPRKYQVVPFSSLPRVWRHFHAQIENRNLQWNPDDVQIDFANEDVRPALESPPRKRRIASSVENFSTFAHFAIH